MKEAEKDGQGENQKESANAEGSETETGKRLLERERTLRGEYVCLFGCGGGRQ